MGGVNCYSALAKACKSLSGGWTGPANPETFSLLESEDDYAPAEILSDYEIQKLMSESQSYAKAKQEILTYYMDNPRDNHSF